MYTFRLSFPLFPRLRLVQAHHGAGYAPVPAKLHGPLPAWLGIYPTRVISHAGNTDAPPVVVISPTPVLEYYADMVCAVEIPAVPLPSVLMGVPNSVDRRSRTSVAVPVQVIICGVKDQYLRRLEDAPTLCEQPRFRWSRSRVCSLCFM